MSNKCLIVVDMQNDFVTGALGSPEAQAILPNVEEKIKSALASSYKVIFTRDTHTDEYLDTEEGKNLPVKHCIKDTEGWRFAGGLEAYIENEQAEAFEKDTFGCLKFIERASSMKAYQDYFDEIELIGLCTDICVISNAVVAKTAFPNAHIRVDAACCAGVTPKSHDTALDAMTALQIEILNRGKEPWR